MVSDFIEYVMVLAAVAGYVGLCLLVGWAATKFGRSRSNFVVVSLLVTPLVAFVLLLVVASDDRAEDFRKGRMVRCPVCAEWIQAAATKCPRCLEMLSPSLATAAASLVVPGGPARMPAPQAPPAPDPQPTPASPPQRKAEVVSPAPAVAQVAPAAPVGVSQTSMPAPLERKAPASTPLAANATPAPVVSGPAVEPARIVVPPVVPTPSVAPRTAAPPLKKPDAVVTPPEISRAPAPVGPPAEPAPSAAGPPEPEPIKAAEAAAAPAPPRPDILEKIARLRHQPANQHPPGFYEKVLEALHHDEASVREEAARFLGRHYRQGGDAQKLLEMVVADPDAEVRRAAAECLGGIFRNTSDRQANEILATVAKNAQEQGPVRAAAYAAIKRINSY